MREEFFVEIRPYSEDETDPGFRRMGPMPKRDAERVSAGAGVNLNHERYYTQIVSRSPKEDPQND